jgi:hypothetical protein
LWPPSSHSAAELSNLDDDPPRQADLYESLHALLQVGVFVQMHRELLFGGETEAFRPAVAVLHRAFVRSAHRHGRCKAQSSGIELDSSAPERHGNFRRHRLLLVKEAKDGELW